MHDRGYETVEGLYSADECADLLAEIEHNIARSRAGARHLMSHPAVRRIAADERLLKLARAALGQGAVPYRATLFEKSGRSNWLVVWHQDTALPLASRLPSPEWGPWSEKAGVLYAHAPTWALQKILALRLHLDDSTADNGPLRAIPGSHAHGVLPDERVFEIAHKQPPTECLAPRGSILAMRPVLIHSSQKAVSPEPRRVLHLEYAAALDLGNGARLAVAKGIVEPLP